MTRTYWIVCPSCSGSGFINDPIGGNTTVAKITCPDCNGCKVVLCMETIDYIQPERHGIDDLKLIKPK
jgi:DnaJ-class molecular chaperone